MSEPLLAARGLTKQFGAVVATDDLDLDVNPGEVHGVIGPNGAGKTTLIGQLTGEITPNRGRIYLRGADITRLAVHARAQCGLARSFQITSIFPSFSTLENVALAVQSRSGHSFRFWRPAAGDSRLNDPAMESLTRVGLAGRAAVPAASLAHGEKRQLEIAMALASRPSVLLLDEPMAGMGAEESERMVALLASLKGSIAILLVEHDMDAVFALADRITVLVNGRAIATGRPAEIRSNAGVRLAYLGGDAAIATGSTA